MINHRNPEKNLAHYSFIVDEKYGVPIPSNLVRDFTIAALDNFDHVDHGIMISFELYRCICPYSLLYS